jgi:hypothetical protein
MAALKVADLSPEKGLVFRITHIRNLPWILGNGLHCASSEQIDPNFVSIGNADLIDSRKGTLVPHNMGGTLADYVPFYFTPRSPMLYNIKTGHNGVTRRPNDEIIVLVSSIQRFTQNALSFLIANRHAIYQRAEFSSDPAFVEQIDWGILQASKFNRNDNNDPDKIERYQAETLVRQHVPISALLGLACASDAARAQITIDLNNAQSALQVHVRNQWYF